VKDLNLRRQRPRNYGSPPIGRSGNPPRSNKYCGNYRIVPEGKGYLRRVRAQTALLCSEGALTMAADYAVSTLPPRSTAWSLITRLIRRSARSRPALISKNAGFKESALEGDKVLIGSGREKSARRLPLDVVKDKMIRRGVSLKHLRCGRTARLSGKIYEIAAPLKEGISTENAKKIAKKIRDEGPKIREDSNPRR